MRGNLKALGLALVAGLAMSAVGASAAQATQGQFTADAYPAVIQGKTHGAENYFETTPGSKIECTDAYEATLSAASTELTVTYHRTNCLNGRETILNGCDLRFRAGTNTSPTDTHGSADIICPQGKQIEFVTKLFGSTVCTVDIPAQTGLTGVTFTNITNGDVTVDVSIMNQLKYTDTDLSGFCPFEKTETYSDGDLVYSILLEGFKDAGHTVTSTGTTGYVPGSPTDIDVR